jgi:hypothetical protein
MKLLYLRVACYLYNQFTDYDSSYLELQNKYPILDLKKTEQVKALIKWLRSWGCRQFKTNNEDISINSIVDWYELNKSNIPSPDAHLIDYDLVTNKNKIINLFNKLSERKAATKERGNNNIDVRIGPVGTAKILFALRPNIFSPWDTPIYKKLQLEGNGAGYISYISKVKRELNEIRETLKNTTITWDGLFKYLNKRHRCYPKLIDEYYWITITRGCDPSEIERILKQEILKPYAM